MNLLLLLAIAIKVIMIVLQKNIEYRPWLFPDFEPHFWAAPNSLL